MKFTSRSQAELRLRTSIERSTVADGASPQMRMVSFANEPFHMIVELTVIRAHGGAMLDTTATTRMSVHATPEQRLRQQPRKVRLDSDLYRSHSLRASAGDANCDHDFEAAPSATGADFALWKCTKCSRVFRYETWERDRRQPDVLDLR